MKWWTSLPNKMTVMKEMRPFKSQENNSRRLLSFSNKNQKLVLKSILNTKKLWGLHLQLSLSKLKPIQMSSAPLPAQMLSQINHLSPKKKKALTKTTTRKTAKTSKVANTRNKRQLTKTMKMLILVSTKRILKMKEIKTSILHNLLESHCNSNSKIRVLFNIKVILKVNKLKLNLWCKIPHLRRLLRCQRDQIML